MIVVADLVVVNVDIPQNTGAVKFMQLDVYVLHQVDIPACTVRGVSYPYTHMPYSFSVTGSASLDSKVNEIMLYTFKDNAGIARTTMDIRVMAHIGILAPYEYACIKCEELAVVYLVVC